MFSLGIDASRANCSNRTGTEWYVFNLIQQFKQLLPADEVQVTLYTKEALVDDLQPLPKHWRHQILRWPPGLLWTQLRLSVTMLNPWKRPDVLFIPAHTIPIIHPQQTVYTAHDLGFERWPQLYANILIGGSWLNRLIRVISLGRYSTSEFDYHRWSMRYAARHARHIIAISQFTAHELMELYQVSSDRITVVHNGVTTKDYHPLPATVIHQPVYFLYTGRIEHKKNIRNLITGFIYAKQHWALPHQLWLVGQPGYGYEDIVTVAKQSDYQADIKFLGYVPQAQMNSLMNQAAAFIFPSYYEGFGIPVLEAMSAHTVVVCSNIPALREVVGQAGLFFEPNQSATIAQALYQVAQFTDQQRQRYVAAGIEQLKKFSWPSCAEETWQVLRRVVQ
ncbi:MAG: glycosyltransferase family 4 protein [Candidatus Kerfeldbacteria bacterium]|nr:glycosyltransferase family 4 protein [Candidatus Kerfeldbacteria bacterium]